MATAAATAAKKEFSFSWEGKDKAGKVYTSHWQTSPKHYIKETCLACHAGWKEEQARYVIESLNGHIQGKTRKAEFWLTRLIDKFEEAGVARVDEAGLAPYRSVLESQRQALAAEDAFEKIWAERGPTDHGFATEYRGLASTIIAALIKANAGRQLLGVYCGDGAFIKEPASTGTSPVGANL